MTYSIIIPVFNRPDEVAELLESLTRQTVRDFEVIIVEDGSSVPCRAVCEQYADRLDLHYYEKQNSGPGPSRNDGVERASGRFVIILDSDVVLPEGYLAAINEELERADTDAFGGPDRAHPSFTPTQRAINYAMTSFFTTGGIRGGKRKMDRFFPRSFNMGVRTEVYRALNGFSAMRFGEDIDFSTRLIRSGYRSRLMPGAWVWHKRRTDLRKFFKQVHNSGIARIHLMKRHPGTLKLVHLLPAVFTVGLTLCAVLCAVAAVAGCPHWWVMLLPPALFAVIIGADATRAERSAGVGMRAIAASLVQLTGYGSGFLRAWWQCCVLKRGEFEAFHSNFYK